MRVGVARKRETVLTPLRPHIIEVSANVLCDNVDSLTGAGNDGRCVAMHRVKLENRPVGGVEEGGVHASLEEEGVPTWGNCRTKVVFVLTCDVEVTNHTAVTILQPLRHVHNHVEALVEVITRDCIADRQLPHVVKRGIHILGQRNRCLRWNLVFFCFCFVCCESWRCWRCWRCWLLRKEKHIGQCES